LSRLRAWWTKDGGAAALRKPLKIDYATRSEVRKIAESYGGSDGSAPLGDAAQQRQRLLDLGPAAVPGLTQIGLRYPAGWSDKRALICQVLGLLREPDAVPALIAVLRDPVIAVAAWGCDALNKIDDEESLPAVQRYHQRLLSLASQGQIPQSAGTPDALIAMAASTCYRLGDARLEPDLVGFLLSDDEQARRSAHDALREHYGNEFDYDLDAPPKNAAPPSSVGRRTIPERRPPRHHPFDAKAGSRVTRSNRPWIRQPIDRSQVLARASGLRVCTSSAPRWIEASIQRPDE